MEISVCSWLDCGGHMTVALDRCWLFFFFFFLLFLLDLFFPSSK